MSRLDMEHDITKQQWACVVANPLLVKGYVSHCEPAAGGRLPRRF
jgi:hypothetical protein